MSHRFATAFAVGLLLAAPGCAGDRALASEAAPARPGAAGEGGVAPSPAPRLADTEHVGTPGELAQLGTIAGQPLGMDELIEAWHALSPRDLWLVVDKLVATRLARAEAGRLGVVLSPELVETEVARERERLAASVAEAAPGIAVEDFVAGRLGVEPARYFRGLRSQTLERMLTERAARAWVLGQESRAVRLLVVRADEVEAVHAALADGADLETLARERSLDDTASAGGLVPFLVATEGSLLAEAAFDAAPGELVGPLASEELRLFLRVERVRPAIAGDWDVLGPRVEESLATTPLADSEYVPWKLAMERRWPVDLGPLGDLVGAAR